MSKKEANGSLKESLADIKKIVDWFEKQEEVDIEEGLKKVKEGAALIKAAKKRLGEIENEFTEIENEL